MYVYILNEFFIVVCFRGHFLHFLTYRNQYSWYLSAYTSINFVHEYLMEIFCFIFFHMQVSHILAIYWVRNTYVILEKIVMMNGKIVNAHSNNFHAAFFLFLMQGHVADIAYQCDALSPLTDDILLVHHDRNV